ncbi:deoxyribose-phosphate aldolase [Synechococcus sp. PCC 7502]|uniref:deoxyribose-phosphate aldolase n=1 Tax=Synechococcus sp. PCC 7502 TaxID=1173263 RepID=UPI00029FDFEE|nr:deoxyribose-phosphate aldolase [Synechococcus sp. PCC 7502]AFY74144.1 deoxyribose-phosphate aldolase [Synechococcus sp. PCC 7502]
MSESEINPAPYIDHAILNPTAVPEQIDQACHESDRYGFASVCVYPCYVKRAADQLNKTRVLVSTVIGFPSGASTPSTKLYEAQEAVENGAQELDVVLNLGLIKAGNADALLAEIAPICEITKVPIKAILEMNLLTTDEQVLAAEVCLDAGVMFLKTSTGWAGGATIEQVKLLKSVGRGRVGIKASGGIRTLAQAIALIEAGATRLGTSRSVEIMAEFKDI